MSQNDVTEGEITVKFQSLKRVPIEDTKGFISSEKFRDVRETGPRSSFSGVMFANGIMLA